MYDLTAVDAIKTKYEILKFEFDERGRRIWAATEANFLGHGGVAIVAKATGLSDSTIKAGRRELKKRLDSEQVPSKRRVRKSGGGRKHLLEKDDQLLVLLEALVDPTSRGDPMSPLRLATYQFS